MRETAGTSLRVVFCRQGVATNLIELRHSFGSRAVFHVNDRIDDPPLTALLLLILKGEQ